MVAVLAAEGAHCFSEEPEGRGRDPELGGGGKIHPHSAHPSPSCLLGAACHHSASWSQALGAFGIPAISPAEPIAIALHAIDHRDGAVRDGAMRLLLAVRRAVGERLIDRQSHPAAPSAASITFL